MRKNMKMAPNEVKQLFDKIHSLEKQIANIKEIVNEPDPHGEKYKEKLWRLKEMLQ